MSTVTDMERRLYTEKIDSLEAALYKALGKANGDAREIQRLEEMIPPAGDAEVFGRCYKCGTVGVTYDKNGCSRCQPMKDGQKCVVRVFDDASSKELGLFDATYRSELAKEMGWDFEIPDVSETGRN